jgi:hypothetical protein
MTTYPPDDEEESLPLYCPDCLSPLPDDPAGYEKVRQKATGEVIDEPYWRCPVCGKKCALDEVTE